jgi:hypothetical protein
MFDQNDVEKQELLASITALQMQLSAERNSPNRHIHKDIDRIIDFAQETGVIGATCLFCFLSLGLVVLYLKKVTRTLWKHARNLGKFIIQPME